MSKAFNPSKSEFHLWYISVWWHVFRWSVLVLAKRLCVQEEIISIVCFSLSAYYHICRQSIFLYWFTPSCFSMPLACTKQGKSSYRSSSCIRILRLFCSTRSTAWAAHAPVRFWCFFKANAGFSESGEAWRAVRDKQLWAITSDDAVSQNVALYSEYDGMILAIYDVLCFYNASNLNCFVSR